MYRNKNFLPLPPPPPIQSGVSDDNKHPYFPQSDPPDPLLPFHPFPVHRNGRGQSNNKTFC